MITKAVCIIYSTRSLISAYILIPCVLQSDKANRVEIFKRAEKYAKEYHQAERDLIKNKRDARKSGNFYVPAQPKLAFVMRIRG